VSTLLPAGLAVLVPLLLPSPAVTSVVLQSVHKRVIIAAPRQKLPKQAASKNADTHARMLEL